jgi:ribose transport system ATP-binding protein
MSEDVLHIDAVALRPDVEPLSLTVRPGEIVGLAGLDGHGQEAFLMALAGLAKPARGVVSLGGVAVGTFRQAVAKGIAYLPRDRRATGLFPGLSVLDNFCISTVGVDAPRGLISREDRRARFAEYVSRLSINAPDWDAPITTLSGGNQQKVLLARALALKPRVLLLNDPTRGVDVATRLALYDVFRDLAAEGMALVVLSSEIEEIIRLCHGVLVFREYTKVARLRGEDMTSEAVIAAMFGRKAA